MEKSLISIIVSVYNGEKYLGECIESVLNQDYKNIEFIIVNDGSPDGSLAIIKKYAAQDSRIKLIDKENGGVSHSRNAALDIAKGDYVCIIDQDDVLGIDYVSYFYKLIVENEAEIALTPDVIKFFGKVNEAQSETDYVSVISGEEAAITMLYHKYVIAPWNKMISRDLIERNNLRFNTKYFNGEGFAYSVQAFQYANRVAVGHRKVYCYRVGDPNSGASVFKEEYIHSSIDAQQYIKNTMPSQTSELMKAWEFSNWHTHCDALNVMVGCGVTKTHSELYKTIKSVCKDEAWRSISAPISLQQKLRCIMFAICPYMAAKVINTFRVRKFKKA